MRTTVFTLGIAYGTAYCILQRAQAAVLEASSEEVEENETEDETEDTVRACPNVSLFMNQSYEGGYSCRRTKVVDQHRCESKLIVLI